MQEDCELSESLKDRTFVDFFNVYLSLPIFSQKIFYKFEEKDFEFEPPLKKSKYILDKPKLIRWLVTERIELFKATPFYQEFMLCQQLLKTRLYFTSSSHKLDYEQHRYNEDREFVTHCIGNVVGMRQFRFYLRGTVGEKLVNFWMDAQLFQSIPNDNLYKKWRIFRDIQTKYFRGKNLGTFDLLKEGADVIAVDNWEGSKHNYYMPVDTCYADAPNDELIKIMKSTDYSEIQRIIITVLKGYWLQRYALHSKLLKEKLISKKDAGTGEDLMKMLSPSDMVMLKDIKEYDKALNLLQGTMTREQEFLKDKAVFNWKAMFPEHIVDDSFLDENGDIVTLHKNGSVTVDPIDPTLDEILAKYITEKSSSSSDENNFRESDYLGDSDKKSKQSIKAKTSSRALSAMSGLKKCRASPKESVSASKSKPTSKENLPVRSQMSFAELVKEAVSAKNSKERPDSKEGQSPDNASKPVSIELMQKVVKSECRRSQTSLSNANRCLFDQLLELNNDANTKEANKRQTQKRPQTGPQRLMLTTRNKSILPDIGSRSQFASRINGECGDSSERNTGVPPMSVDQYLFPPQNEVVSTVCPESYTGTSAVIIEDPVFKYKNMCEGYFRYDNQLLLLCVAMDSTVGYPFEQFLVKQRANKRLTLLNFWNDAQVYLLTPVSDPGIKLRRAKLIIVRYMVNRRFKFLPSDLSKALQNLLPFGKGDDILREAQDFVCKYMQSMLDLYQRKDMRKFIDACIIRKQRYRNKTNKEINGKNVFLDNRDGIDNDMPLNSTEGNAGLKNNIAIEEMFDKDNIDDLPREKRERLIKATQFVLDAANKLDEGLPIDAIEYDKLEWDPKDEYGSLLIQKLVTIKRRDLLEYKERLKLVAQQKKARLEMEEKKMKDQIKFFIHKDDTPFYMKPFKKNGLWYQRPNRPRTFQDVIKDHVHREFFRRFLIYHTAESPMNFFNAVEDVKNMTDLRARQNRMNHINRKYFASVATAMDLLNTDADIIQAIPQQDKVTMAMLISAQSWVVRGLNDNWFEKYQNTFPEISKDEIASGVIRLLADGGNREFGKQRTKYMWQSIVKSVIHFRRDIHNPSTVKLFEGYLKLEIRKEVEKQKSSHGYAHGMPIRKVIRNKLVDVTKLVCDLHFVAESDRFRSMTDDARYNADVGTYCVEEEVMIENKAKLIVDCFIDSDIPPRCQVNLTNDQVENIIKAYKGGLFDRNLFRIAFISIFPVVVYLWKRFKKYQFVQLYEKFMEKRNKNEKNVTKHVRTVPEIPDYINTTLQSVITKRVIPHKGEEDICKLTFSMSRGMRMVLPMFTATAGISSQAHQRDDIADASAATLARGPSFLQKRRYAMVSSKLGLNVDVHEKSSTMIRNSSIGRPSSRFGNKPLPHLGSKHSPAPAVVAAPMLEISDEF